MPRRRPRSTLAARSTELAWAVPQVVGHRLARLASAGPTPTARDRREFHRMGAEKASAFAESWVAMGSYWFRLQQAWATAWWGWTLMPWRGAMPWPPSGRQWQTAAQGLLSHGLAPVHRRAVANAKRLGRPAARR
jgi:hypothetical protein